MNRICFLAVLTLLPSFAGSAKTDFDPAVDFSRFKTFAIVSSYDLDRSGWLEEPGMRERFRNFVSGALETRGLVEVPNEGTPSLAVRFWVARREKQDVSVFSYGSSTMWAGYPPYYSGYWGYSYEEYVVRDYEDGTLVVDLIDPANKELVWRTILKQKIEDRAKAYTEAKKNLYKAMAAMPPSAEAKAKMTKEREKLAKKYK